MELLGKKLWACYSWNLQTFGWATPPPPPLRTKFSKSPKNVGKKSLEHLKLVILENVAPPQVTDIWTGIWALPVRTKWLKSPPKSAIIMLEPPLNSEGVANECWHVWSCTIFLTIWAPPPTYKFLHPPLGSDFFFLTALRGGGGHTFCFYKHGGGSYFFSGWNSY